MTARGFASSRIEVVPTEDRTIPVRMQRRAIPARRDGGEQADASGGPTTPLSGPGAGSTVEGRLGTTFVNVYGEDAS